MGMKKITIRNIALLVIFVMLIICSILTFSYAYYSSSGYGSEAFGVHNVSIDCLSITTSSSDYSMITSLPSYFYPVSDNYAKTTWGDVASNGLGNEHDMDYTGKAFGQESINIKNNCNDTVYFDVLFVPTMWNNISLNYIKFAYCIGDWPGSCWKPTSSSYSATYTLGNRCWTGNEVNQDVGFWRYMASTKVGGLPLGGIDQRMCSFFRQGGSAGMPIGATSSYKITIRYWLSETTPVAQYNGRLLSGKFIVYAY